MGRSLIALVVVCFVFTATSALGWGVPSIGKKESAASSMTLEEAGGMQKQLVEKYIEASMHESDAKIMMANAFGMKDLAATLEADKVALSSGNTDAVKDISAKSEETTKQIEKVMEEKKLSSNESKELYAKSLIPYGKSVLASKDMADLGKKCIEAAKDQVSNASLSNAMKVKSTLDVILSIGPELPGHLKNVLTTGSKFVSYAKSNDIQIPNDASASMGDL
jgi:hypothetical protein